MVRTRLSTKEASEASQSSCTARPWRGQALPSDQEIQDNQCINARHARACSSTLQLGEQICISKKACVTRGQCSEMLDTIWGVWGGVPAT